MVGDHLGTANLGGIRSAGSAPVWINRSTTDSGSGWLSTATVKSSFALDRFLSQACFFLALRAFLYRL